jgi:hypothetical protein
VACRHQDDPRILPLLRDKIYLIYFTQDLFLELISYFLGDFTSFGDAPGDLLTRSTLRSLSQRPGSRSYEEKKTTLCHRGLSGTERRPFKQRTRKKSLLPPRRGPSGPEPRTVCAATAGTARRPVTDCRAVHLVESNPRYCSSQEGPRVRYRLVPNRW